MKIEINPLYRKKANFEKHVRENSVGGNVAKFGCHSLNGLKLFIFFPGLNRVNLAPINRGLIKLRKGF